MLYLTGIVVTFFLAALLIGKKGKSKADRWLATWLTVVGIHLSLFYLLITGQSFKYPFLDQSNDPFLWSHWGDPQILIARMFKKEMDCTSISFFYYCPSSPVYRWRNFRVGPGSLAPEALPSPSKT